MSSTKLTDHFANRKSNQPLEHRKDPRKDGDDRIPSVSQAGSNQKEELHFLRQFDLDPIYGPSTGLTRMERWDRAKKFGLNPPEEVRDMVLTHHADDAYTHCVWDDYSTL